MINRKSVCDMIVDSVIEQIEAHELKPGDKLPNEKEMAEQYGVSRISLREALRVLMAKGLIVTRHGEGSFVNEYDPKLFGDLFYQFSLLNPAPILELLQLRKIMETEAVRLCCEAATEQEIAEIRKHKELHEAYCAKEQTPKNVDAKYEEDRLFHLSIAVGTHNTIFVQFMETIHNSILLHQRASFQPETAQKTISFHNAILEAIERRDANKAASVMEEHLKDVESGILSTVSTKS